MAERPQKEKHKIHVKYRISVINEDTFDEVRRVRLSVFNTLLFIAISLLISGLIVVSLVFFTPLREYVPGYPNSETQMQMLENAEAVDSLIVQLNQQELYLEGIRKILKGDISEESYIDTSAENTKKKILDLVKLEATEAELVFRSQVEEEEQYNLGLLELADETKSRQTYLLSPVKGLITDQFNEDNNHFGVDIATKPNEHILSVAKGTVIMVDYSISAGNIISIQHENNIVSTYRHASKIFKKIGAKVSSGEVIGIVGSTGTLSTGIHLHLEIWQNGEPVDPETLIVF